MLLDGMTTVFERICVTAGMLLAGEFSRIGDAAADGRGGGGFR
jgi:hypothetical protein